MKGVGRELALRRVAARVVDLAIVVLVFFIPRIGTTVAVLAALGLDALPGGSPGKRLMGLVVKRADGAPLSLGGSVFRNLPIGVIVLLAGLPGIFRWLLAPILALVTAAFETSLLWSDSRGQRVFDILASTIVCDARLEQSGPVARSVDADEEER